MEGPSTQGNIQGLLDSDDKEDRVPPQPLTDQAQRHKERVEMANSEGVGPSSKRAWEDQVQPKAQVPI